MSTAKKPRKPTARYRAVVGVEISGKRFEQGETVSGVKIPKWMVAGGKVEKVEAG